MNKKDKPEPIRCGNLGCGFTALSTYAIKQHRRFCRAGLNDAD